MKKYKKLILIAFSFIAICLCIRMVVKPISNGNVIDLSDENPASSGTGWTFLNNTYTILENADVTVIGNSSGSSRRIKVANSATAKLTINNVTINGSTTPITLGTSANLSLQLVGENNLTPANGHCAGIDVPNGSSLTIDGDGSLYAKSCTTAYYLGAPAIGGIQSCGTITINGGNIEAIGNTDRGAAIGGGASGTNGGNITINGGNIIATSLNGARGAAIGGAGGGSNADGNAGNCGNVVINGGTVIATGSRGAGIGGGSNNIECSGKGIGNITITGGTVVASSLGIGSYASNKDGFFKLEGNAVVAANFYDFENEELTSGILFKGSQGTLYGDTVKPTADFALSSGQTLTIPSGSELNITSDITVNNAGTIIPSDGSTVTIEGTVSGNKINGANINDLTVGSVGTNGVTINASTLKATTGQAIEYAVNTTNSASSATYQDSPTFDQLNPDTQYYLFARSKENSNFYAGSTSSALPIKTAPLEDTTKPKIMSITLIHEESGNDIEYVSGSWSNSDIKAKYIVKDPNVSGATTSGIDDSGYYISLDGGTNYYNAKSSSPTGVAVTAISEDELEFIVSLEGEHNLKIKSTDKKGNYSESESKNLKIDKTKPVPPATVSSPATSYTNVNTPSISGTGEPGCTVTIKEGNSILRSTLVNQNQMWSTTLPPLIDGVHNISITQTDSALNTSDEASTTLKIDTTGPLGEINIKENKFTTFLNKVTFGMFFKNNIDITFNASDENGSGIKKIEYLKTDSEFQTEQEVIEAQGWVETAPGTVFKVNSNDSPNKFIIYSKITDNAGNVTCINSNGVIVYKDSAQDTSEMVFTKTSTNNLNAVVRLNGNTISKIVNSTENVILTENTHYSISGNTITFYHTYLDSLSAGEYTFTIHYNPAGQPFSQGVANNDAPATTSIKLDVQKSVQSAIVLTGINSPYTYGDNSFPINIDGGDGSGSVSYSSSDESVATISSNTVTILKVGTFTITATKAGDENYQESSFISNLIVVNPKPVSITGLSAKDKVYDANANASILGTPHISGKLDNDDLTVNFGQALFDNKHAQPYKTVHFSGFSLSGNDLSNYTLSSQPNDVSAEIFKRPVTINKIYANDKIYDGTTNATVAINDDAEILDNLDGENLIFNTGKAAFGDKTVGENKLVSFTEFALSGPASPDYILASQPTPTSANITAKNLSIINLSVSDKPYDGLNVASISSTPSLDGLISGDNVILINGVPTFSSNDVSQNINIIFSDFYLSGSDSNNYSLIQPSGITASITEGFSPQIDTHYTLNLPDGANFWYISNNFIITAKNGYVLSTDNKNDSLWKNELVYSDQTADFEVSFYVRDINTKEISKVTSQHYKKDNVHPTGVIQIKQNEFRNFLNTVTFGLFFKEKIEVKIYESDNLSGTEKIEYFKSDVAYSNISEILQSSWIDGGTINNNSISFYVDPDSWNPDEVNEKFFVYAKITDYAGNICYLRSDGVVIYTDSTQNTPSISFTKTSISSQFASVNLNGNTIKTIFNGNQELLNGTDYQVNGSKIEFKPSYLDSLLAGNYSLTIHYNPAGVTYVQAEGNSAPLTTSIDVSISKASQNPFNIVGLNLSYTYGDAPFGLSIDSGSGTGATSFVSSNPSVATVENNVVTILSKGSFTITATKDSDENYNVCSAQSQVVTVNPKPVTLGQIEVSDKIYDGNNVASISKVPTSITGNVDGQNLTFSIGKAFFDSNYAGDNKTVTFDGFFLEGTSATNYILTSQPEPTKANITRRPVNILGLSSSNKIYDSRTEAKIVGNAIITNKLESDNVEVKYGKANFSDKNVGSSKEVTFSEFDIIGDQSSNYFIESQPVSVLADIEPKGVDITNLNINSKIYDKTTDATFKSNPNLYGIIEGDDVSLMVGTPSFSDSAVSKNIPIEFTLFDIQGIDSQNYYLNSQPSGITADINPKELVIKNIKIKDKIFDGYNTAEFETEPTLDGIIFPDEVTLLIGTPTFSFTDVSQNVPIIFTPEFSIAGKDSSNYVLAPHSQISANIDMSQSFNQRDASTNLWIEAPKGVFPEGAKLVVKEFPDNSPNYQEVLYNFDDDKKRIAEKFKLFEIHVVDKNGNIVQPNADNGLVTIRIPIPSDFDKDDLEVYRVLFDLPDDEFSECVVDINSNHYCEFKTDHFSPYALIDKKSDNNFSKIIIILFIVLTIIIIGFILVLKLSKRLYTNYSRNLTKRR